MAVIPEFRATTVSSFIAQNVAPGSTIHNDGLKSFAGLQEIGFKHIPRTQPLRTELSKGTPAISTKWPENRLIKGLVSEAQSSRTFGRLQHRRSLGKGGHGPQPPKGVTRGTQDWLPGAKRAMCVSTRRRSGHT